MAIRKRGALLLLVGGMVLGTVLLLRQPPPVPSPPSKGTVVPGTQGVYPIHGSLWLSSSEVVCFRRLISAEWDASVVNTKTGAQTELTAFNAKFSRELPVGNYSVQMSPDGKWLLWAAGGDPFTAVSLDGSRKVVRQRITTGYSGNNVPFAWEHDSRHWIGVCQGQSQVIVSRYSLDSPKVETIPIQSPYFDVGWSVWVTPKNHTIVEEMQALQFQGFDLVRNSMSVGFTLSLPQGVQMNELVLSPAGDRVAVLGTTYYQSTPLLVWLRGLFSRRSNGPPPSTSSLWVGSVGNPFGDAPPHQVTLPGGTESTFLHWTPDGKWSEPLG